MHLLVCFVLHISTDGQWRRLLESLPSRGAHLWAMPVIVQAHDLMHSAGDARVCRACRRACCGRCFRYRKPCEDGGEAQCQLSPDVQTSIGGRRGPTSFRLGQPTLPRPRLLARRGGGDPSQVPPTCTLPHEEGTQAEGCTCHQGGPCGPRPGLGLAGCRHPRLALVATRALH